jgi:hypothetical protein
LLGLIRLSHAVSEGVVSVPTFVKIPLADGSSTWQARCSLNKTRPQEKPLYLYAGYGGAGCASSRTLASRKAICEVLERWAFDVCRQDLRDRVKYSFDSNPTTDGMAAFPEFKCRNVRNKAKHEAVERWALLAWWKGLLPNTPPTIEKNGLRRSEIRESLAHSL